MKWALLFAVGACVPVEDDPPPPTGELALYRVESGESIGYVAEKLRFPGGYRALRRALGKQTDELRADEGLAIPIAYTRELGIDPYLDLGLEPYQLPLPDEPLFPCRTSEDRGSCVELGDRTLCVEETPPRATTGDPEIEPEYDCSYDADDAADCPRVTGRELVLRRGGQRRVIASLPSGGKWRHGVLEVETHLIDLDGDHVDELLAIVPVDVYSRGGIDHRRLFVIDGRTERVTQLAVEQWGDGSIVANDRATCDVLVTGWDSGYLDPRLPIGSYLIGRRYEYEHGELLPRGDRHVRRLRDFFHIDQDGGTSTPAHWLTEPGTSRWADLPARGDFRRGRIAAIRASTGAGVILDIAFADGSHAVLDPLAEGAKRLARLGWAPSASPLADLYIPGDLERWRGAEVLVDVPPPPAEDYDHDLGREVWIAP